MSFQRRRPNGENLGEELLDMPVQQLRTHSVWWTLPQAVVLEAVDADNGRIKLAGEIWSARTLDEGARFEPGEKDAVFEIDGATAEVG